MIRRLLSALILLSTTLYGVAQTHYVPHISIGGHGGVSLSEYTFNPSTKQSLHIGFFAGARFRYAEERHVGIVAELNVNQRGWRENFEDTDYRYSRSLTFIELPVMTHIFFGGRTFKGFINLGPQIGYMISSSISSNFDYTDPMSNPGFPIRRALDQMKLPIHNRFDYGIAGGVGLEVNVNRRNALTLEGRFYYGLADIFSSSRRDPFSSSRGMSITVTAGYWFRLK